MASQKPAHGRTNYDSSYKLTGRQSAFIVGASHKPYFEAYLDQMHDVEVVSTDEILKYFGRF